MRLSALKPPRSEPRSRCAAPRPRPATEPPCGSRSILNEYYKHYGDLSTGLPICIFPGRRISTQRTTSLVHRLPPTKYVFSPAAESVFKELPQDHVFAEAIPESRQQTHTEPPSAPIKVAERPAFPLLGLGGTSVASVMKIIRYAFLPSENGSSTVCQKVVT